MKINSYTEKALEALSRAYNIVDYFFWLYSLEKISLSEYEHWVNYAYQLVDIYNYYCLLANIRESKPEKTIFI